MQVELQTQDLVGREVYWSVIGKLLTSKLILAVRQADLNIQAVFMSKNNLHMLDADYYIPVWVYKICSNFF